MTDNEITCVCGDPKCRVGKRDYPDGTNMQGTNPKRDLLVEFMGWLPGQWQWLGESEPSTIKAADALFKCMDFDFIIDRFLKERET